MTYYKSIFRATFFVCITCQCYGSVFISLHFTSGYFPLYFGNKKLGHDHHFSEHTIFSLETVPILDIHGLTLLNEFYTNQDISLNMKITFSKLKLLLIKRKMRRDFYLDIDT